MVSVQPIDYDDDDEFDEDDMDDPDGEAFWHQLGYWPAEYGEAGAYL